MRSWDEIQALAGHPQVLAFSHVLREGESNQLEDAFHILYGGGRFESFADHPRIRFPIVYQGKPNYTTAAGAFQIVERTWNEFTAKFGPMDFSPGNQMLCTVWLIERAGALDDVIEGRLDAAIRKLGPVWTSLQLTKIKAKAPEVFRKFGGSLSRPADPPSTPKEVKTMGVFAALLPTLLQLIPTLGSLFPGGEVATRNVAAGTAVVKAITEATQAVNLQDAVEKMQSDPVALQAAKEAVHELLPQLTDFGGGVGDARKFAAENESNRYGRILEVVTYAALAFLALANAMSFTAAFLKDDYSQIAAVIQADIGVGLMAFGFFLGSSLSSKRKDEVKGIQ